MLGLIDTETLSRPPVAMRTAVTLKEVSFCTDCAGKSDFGTIAGKLTVTLRQCGTADKETIICYATSRNHCFAMSIDTSLTPLLHYCFRQLPSGARDDRGVSRLLRGDASLLVLFPRSLIYFYTAI